ncbi:hypothetical protein K8O68_06995 [Salipaludibacillus sp. CUR1]|uniref:hypothetical protein n=1 Tax=Salipaludibacillus sp. CUR1 TaxID=2820003 RepID=UPI001E29E656|nr:hypothetical protein [Salipaludibacillus sp. CUR1]MCE7792170.1 hypothetical protein [Salipaludibacillus sp. CUR1]
MNIAIGALLILWGVIVLYSSLFRMKKEDYKDKGVIGVSGYIELEFLFKFLNRLPLGMVKGFIILIGVSFITFGIVII